jgi:hypothetical protein
MLPEATAKRGNSVLRVIFNPNQKAKMPMRRSAAKIIVFM